MALAGNAGGRFAPGGVGLHAASLARYLFAHTQVTRIEAETEITNIAEQRALEKAGFTREGVLRSYVFRRGQWRDDALYSVIRSEIDLGDGPDR